MSNEPVVTVEAIKVAIVAILAVLDKFGVWNISPDQQNAIIGLFVAGSVVVAAFVVRAKVTPVASIEAQNVAKNESSG